MINGAQEAEISADFAQFADRLGPVDQHALELETRLLDSRDEQPWKRASAPAPLDPTSDSEAPEQEASVSSPPNSGVHSDAFSSNDRLLRRARDHHAELVSLTRRDVLGRRALGSLAARFIEMRAYEQLGFVRLGDYSRERLGWSERQLYEVAHVGRALARLPALDRALALAEVNWTKARLLATVATADDVNAWLALARTTAVEKLIACVRSGRAAKAELTSVGMPPRSAVRAGIGGESETREAGDTDAEAASAVPPDAASTDTSTARRAEDAALDAAASAATFDDVEDRIDGEERALFRVDCPAEVRCFWNTVTQYASLMSGLMLFGWRAADVIAAEASSCSAPFEDQWQEAPWHDLANDGRLPPAVPRSEGSSTSDASSSARPGDARTAEPCSAGPLPFDTFRRFVRGAYKMDAVALDRAMRSVIHTMQTADADLGRRLGSFFDLGLHGVLGFDTREDYGRELLGMAPRRTREIVGVYRRAERASRELTRAYRNGRLSWQQVQAILPVVSSSNASAWIERAGEVMLRRLVHEVTWAEQRFEDDPVAGAGKLPPPVDEPIPWLRRFGAKRRAGEGDAPRSADHSESTTAADGDSPGAADRTEDATASDGAQNPFDRRIGTVPLSFVGPLGVVQHFRSQMTRFMRPTEPRWCGLERMLAAVFREWIRQPRHRDPIYARDGHRCTTPGCSSLANLQDHHLKFRSAGGSNAQSNRTATCAAHHLNAIHKGTVRARGDAPHSIEWELGVKPGREPFLRLAGERYIRELDRREVHVHARSA